MKTSILIFTLGILAAGPVVAQENVASSSRTPTAAEAVTITDQSEDIVGEAFHASGGRLSSIVLGEQPALRRDHGKTSRSVEQSLNFDYGNAQIAGRALNERIIERLGLFDRPDDGGSARYSVSLDLENEDSDWSFEVTVTIEF